MSWNNGYERRKFEQEQKAQAKEYRKCGMNEEQIQAMYLQDLQEYRNNRVYAIHIPSIEELEGNGEESRNALHKKFLLSMTCTMDMSECGRYGWIDEIENNALYCAICKLNTNQKELLTLLYRDGYSLPRLSQLSASNIQAFLSYPRAVFFVSPISATFARSTMSDSR